MNEFKDYLFEYPFGGKQWGFEIRAVSEDEARERLKAMAWATYKGELHARIPAVAPHWLMAPFVSLYTRWKNAHR